MAADLPDPLIYISVPAEDLARLLDEALTAAGSAPERLKALLEKGAKEDKLQLTTDDLKCIRDHITQVSGVYFYL